MDTFLATTGLKMPHRKSDIGYWWSSIGELYELADRDVSIGNRLIRQSVEQLRAGKMTFSNPNSILNTARSIAANGGGKQVVF
jgi:hypothetical protein